MKNTFPFLANQGEARWACQLGAETEFLAGEFDVLDELGVSVEVQQRYRTAELSVHRSQERQRDRVIPTQAHDAVGSADAVGNAAGDNNSGDFYTFETGINVTGCTCLL